MAMMMMINNAFMSICICIILGFAMRSIINIDNINNTIIIINNNIVNILSVDIMSILIIIFIVVIISHYALSYGPYTGRGNRRRDR